MSINYEIILIPELSKSPIDIGICGNQNEMIVFIPGANVEINEVEDIINSLARKYKVISFRYPNKTTLEAGKEIMLEEYFLILDKIIKKYGEPKALVGQSLGGLISLSYSSVNPQVNKVIAITPPLSRVEMNKTKLLFSNTANIFQATIQQRNFKILKAFKNYLHLIRMSKTQKSINEFKFSKYFKKLQGNYLIFFGTNDYLINLSKNLKVAQELPNVKIIQYEGLGHSLLHVKTDDVVKNIFEFLGD